jgi:glycosyltransferase involved in cell wall biosynthesis
LIKKHNIDVVYTNALPTLDAALAARLNGLPHIWHLHEAVCGNQYLKPYLPCFIVKALIRYFSAKIIFVSNDKAHEFGGNGKSNHSCVVHNGVDIRRFSAGVQTSNSLRGELGLAENFGLVVSVGIVSAHKGHDTLIMAAATILKEFPNAAFILVGNELDDFGDRLRKQIVELGIAEHIFFLGPRKDVPAILAQADLLVHPSTQEALPLVLLEAMASGKPVVATRCGGPEEIVVDGETGYLVPVGDEIALADRIKRILSDPESATRMGVAGRKRAEEKFSVQAYARNIQKIIEEVAESSR